MKKNSILYIFTFLLAIVLYLPNIFAQEISSIRTLTGHTGAVISVAFSPDGMLLASGSDDYTIRLWDVATGEELRTLTGHTDYVNNVAFSPDGMLLASGSDDYTIRLWDVATGEELRTLTGHTDYVNNVAFSPDGTMLASGGLDDPIRLWDVATGEELRTLTGHTSYVFDIAFSPDGSILASSGLDDPIRLWDVATGENIRTLTGHAGYVLDIAFSPDGSILASGGRRDGTIRLWNVATGENLRTLIGHTNSVGVLSVAFSPDGSILASGSGGDTILLWDVATGKNIRTLTGRTADNVLSVAFSPDGSMLARGSSGTTIRLWELPNTRMRLTPIPVVSPAIGEQFTIDISIVSGENVGGYQVSLAFDPTALRYVESANGDYLPSGAYFVPPVISSNTVTLGAVSLAGVGAGDGTLATATFEVLDVKESFIDLFDVILTDSAGEHLPRLLHLSTKVEPALLPTDAIISLTPSSLLSHTIGEHLTFYINITGGQNLSGYQVSLAFDPTALRYVESANGDYLPSGNTVTFAASSADVFNGDATFEFVTFEVLDVKTSAVNVFGHLIGADGLRYKPTFEGAEVIIPLLGDVNRDGVVNILDLVLVASKFGQRVSGDPADVNEDGIVNIVDLVKVASALGGKAAAPSAGILDMDSTFTREQIQQWLSEARQLKRNEATVQQGILYLEQLLAALTPQQTALLANYPNPFNPETWIPYQLAEPTDVTVTIYAVDGVLIRTLPLGHQAIGIYQGKSRAAYWDGRNALGEPVASGVYFYTLSAGEYSATRKMLIRK